MRRTTIFADDELLNEIRELARDEQRSAAELIREAIVSYIAKKREPVEKKLSFLGIGESGRSDVAETHEELLWQKSIKSKRS
jgi:metal-responsive CopG/Arc/MetJ family transcriptional regulator